MTNKRNHATIEDERQRRSLFLCSPFRSVPTKLVYLQGSFWTRGVGQLRRVTWAILSVSIGLYCTILKIPLVLDNFIHD